MVDSDDDLLMETKRNMRIAYAFAFIALTMFVLAAMVTALSAATR